MATVLDQVLKLFITADGRGLSAGLQRSLGEIKNFSSTAQRAFGGIQSAFAALGLTLSAGGIAVGLKKTIDGMDALNDASKRLGVSTEALSALGYAAEQSGASIEDLQNGMKFLGKNLIEARNGSKELQILLKELGVNELGNIEEALLQVADAFAQMPDGAQKAAAAIKLFGRNGLSLIPMLNEGRAGIEKFWKEAERLGIVVSKEAARAADEFNDSLNRLSNELKGVGISLAGPVIGALQDLIIQFNEGRKAAGGFWEALFKFGFKANDPGQQINRLLEDRKKLQESMPALPSAMDPRLAQIEEINKELGYWRALQLRETEKMYAAEFAAADTATKKIVEVNRQAIEEQLAQTEKLKKAYVSLAAAISEGLSESKLAPLGKVQDASVITINRLKDQAQQALERGGEDGATEAARFLKQAKAINDYLLETGQISKTYYQTQADALLKLAEQGQQVLDGTPLTLPVAPDIEGAVVAGNLVWSTAQQAINANGPLKLPGVQIGGNTFGDEASLPTADGRVLISAAGITGRAAGGLISGPGTAVSDSILARLSAGEFVVKAAAVKTYGLGFLERLNHMALPRFATGGMVSTGTPINLYLPGGQSFPMSAQPSVAKQLASILSTEVLKRGRR
jgi:hypothetical protein